MPNSPAPRFTLWFCLLSFLAIVWKLYARFGYPYDNLLFAQDVWMKEADRTKIGVRYQMLDDIVANHLPIGMRKADVVQLLGEPSEVYETELNWTVPVSHVFENERILSAHFDPDQRIRTAALYTE